ncbi:MAG: ATP-dependent Lon protease [Paraglaciecola sp.]|jgi:ATP-dependent Lon protease
MSHLLPLFPLQLVAFPGENLNLHIFEPRYLQLVEECYLEGTTFGIPPFLDKKLMPFGTELKLVEIAKRHSDGKLDVKTEGVGIFRIDEFMQDVPDKLYSAATVDRMELDYEGDFSMVNQIIDKVTELFTVMKIKKDIPENTPQFNTYQIAHHVGFSVEQEYEFLRIPTEIDRQNFMLRHFDKLLPMVKEMETLRQRVQMNGHFKDLKPPHF